jgi:hypothetical protein
MTQVELIRDYLLTGQSLSPLEALEKFGVFRLAARCYDLAKRGYVVKCDLVDVGQGKHVGVYRLG